VLRRGKHPLTAAAGRAAQVKPGSAPMQRVWVELPDLSQVGPFNSCPLAHTSVAASGTIAAVPPKWSPDSPAEMLKS
jgi:hypothetical protein